MIDYDFVAVSLAEMNDADLFVRSVQCHRLGNRSVDEIDRAWRNGCKKEWIRRGQRQRFAEAVAVVAAERRAEADANQRACESLKERPL